MFSWIREKTKAAVLGGIADAMEYLERHGADRSDNAVQQIESRTALLPAPEEDRPERRRTRAER